MNPITTPNPLIAYADKLAAVADPLLISRMKTAGLNRANRRMLASKSRKGTLRGIDFPAWLIARFMSVGDEALA